MHLRLEEGRKENGWSKGAGNAIGQQGKLSVRDIERKVGGLALFIPAQAFVEAHVVNCKARIARRASTAGAANDAQALDSETLVEPELDFWAAGQEALELNRCPPPIAHPA